MLVYFVNRYCICKLYFIHLWINVNIMKDRIQRIIEDKNLTPSTFADEVDLSRAVVSHILHGRNKLSLDNIQKIMKRYPEINPLWLISGSGQMYSEGADVSKTPSLFDETEEFTGDGGENIEYPKENTLRMQQNDLNKRDNQRIETKKAPTVKVNKIAIFYSDNTYEEFVPSPKG